MTPSERLLSYATRCVRADDLTGALDALLQGWRQAPTPALAARVQSLGDDLGQILPPITGENPSDRHERWLARAATAQPVDQRRLLEGLHFPPMTRIYQKLQWVAGQAPDPRWTAIVVKIALQHGFGYWPRLAPSPRRLWALCVKILVNAQDPASADLLHPEAVRIDRGRADPRGALAAFIDRVDALHARLSGFPVNAPPDATLLAEFDAAIAERAQRPPPTAQTLRRPPDAGEAEMRALVYAEPDDLDVRRVYADWLEMRGAPRAELMRLQLQQLDAPKASQRVARTITRLTDRYGAHWLGQLTPFVRDVEWHLGFPSAGDLVFRGREQREKALELDAWRTFTTVHARDPAVLHHPNLAGVRQLGRTIPFHHSQKRLTPMSADVVGGVAQPLPCQHLIVESLGLRALTAALWPALESVEVVAHWSPFDLGDLGDLGCPTLTFWQVDATDIPRIARAIPTTPLLRFVDRSGFRYALDQRQGRSLDVIWAPAHPCTDFDAVPAIVRALAPASIRVLTPNHSQTAAVLNGLRDALAPMPVTLPRPRRTRRS